MMKRSAPTAGPAGILRPAAAIAAAVAPAAAGAAAAAVAAIVAVAALAGPAAAAPYDDAFWKHWGDGRAEVSSYDLTYSRYGQPRTGTAVAIFVTETFSESARVKADPGNHPPDDEFPVMKLNLVQDFQTGIYDYNLMTSAFIALTSRLDRAPGAPVKVSFSSQEWCGQVWQDLVPDREGIRHRSHSYFDGEADQEARLPFPAGGVLEDAVLLWARGLAAPFLAPGETVNVPALRSVEVVRLRHVPEQWGDAVLSRSAGTSAATVPAGDFTVETFTLQTPDRTWTVHVEAAAPRRIVRWSTSDGNRAELIASERVRYWGLNGNEDEAALQRIGLSRRPARTP